MGTGLIIIISIIGYLLMWIITSCLWFVYAVLDYKNLRNYGYINYSFDKWYKMDDQDSRVVISGLFWPITLFIVIAMIGIPIIINTLRKYLHI